MRFSKLHGLGNDFLVALGDGDGEAIVLTAEQARAVCDRRRGIGADGVIVANTPENVATSEEVPDGVDLVMVLRNADGSVAELSGNGIRCLAHAVALARGVRDAEFVIATGGGVRNVQVREAGDTCTVRVGMGSAVDGPEIPDDLVPDGRASTVDVGNPHLVLEVPDPRAIDLAVTGPALEARFVGGINVEFVRIEARNEMSLTVWERGAGITQACGTGAVAAAHAARSWGLVDDDVRVVMPGGTARVELGDEIVLSGPSVYVVDLDVDLERLVRTAVPPAGEAIPHA